MHKFIFCSLLLIAFSASATQQINDTYIFEGKEYEIEVMPYGKSPLESLYSFDEILEKLKLDGGCSANWRGYKGTWEVINNQLYLTRLIKGACSKGAPLVDVKSFFGQDSYPVKATWLNEVIKIRLSKRTPIYCGEQSDLEQTIGMSYDAMVYEFSFGDLVYKSKQSIEDVWEGRAKQCKDGELRSKHVPNKSLKQDK